VGANGARPAGSSAPRKTKTPRSALQRAPHAAATPRMAKGTSRASARGSTEPRAAFVVVAVGAALAFFFGAPTARFVRTMDIGPWLHRYHRCHARAPAFSDRPGAPQRALRGIGALGRARGAARGRPAPTGLADRRSRNRTEAHTTDPLGRHTSGLFRGPYEPN
jgi:hypothetical protein